MSDVPGPGLYSIYTGRITNWGAIGFSAAVSFGTLAVGHWMHLTWVNLDLLTGIYLVGLAGYVITGSNVRVTTGPRGVTVRLGLFGHPTATYRTEDLLDAEIVHLPCWRVIYGLWWTPRTTDWTMRHGPNLRLRMRSGRVVTISVPEPITALAVLTGD